MLVRETNPYGKHLSQSDCIFECTPGATPIQQDWLMRLTDEFHGNVTYLADGRVRVTVPHAQMDAFGGLYFMRDILVGGDETMRLNTSLEEQVGDYVLVYSSKCCSVVHRSKHTQTITQSFLGALIQSFSWTSELLAVVVSMDDLNLIDESNFAGNSLSSVQAQAQRFRQVCDADADVWRKFLRARASRALAMPLTPVTTHPLIVLSSLGNIARYSWCPKLDDVDFRMFPTPNHFGSANIVLWSYGNLQVLSLAASLDHVAYKDFPKIEAIWRGMFDA